MFHFLNAGALWGLLVLAPAIILLYFLKLKRQPVTVSSTLLWRRSVYDLRVNAPFQRLRRNLLLFLQLLVLTLLFLALAHPFMRMMRAQGRQYALIIDCSASMATTDEAGGRSRLDVALDEARRWVETMGQNGSGAQADACCVIAAAHRPRLMCGVTSDRRQLLEAIRAIQLSETETNMAAALEMAVAVSDASKASRTARPEDKRGALAPENERESRKPVDVVLFTDGVFPQIPDALAERVNLSDAEGDDTRCYVFGQPESTNRAIVGLDLHRDPSGERRLFVRVEHMGSASVRVPVDLYLNNAFRDRKEIDLPARGRAGTAGETLPGQAGAVFTLSANAEGLLRVSLPNADRFPLDDEVQAVLTRPRVLSILLVGPGNFFLGKALSVEPERLRVSRMSLDDYANQAALGESEYDLVIFDRVTPKVVPLGATFFIDAVPALPGIREDAKRLYAPVVLDWQRMHPVLRDVEMLESIRLLECRRLVLEGGWISLMDGEGLVLADPSVLSDDAAVRAAPVAMGTLLACYVESGRRVAVLPFNIFNTERWPMRVSFPVFIRNVIEWTTQVDGGEELRLSQTGTPLRVRAKKPDDALQVLLPDGARVAPLANAAGVFLMAQTETQGVYRLEGVSDDVDAHAFALLSGAESNNAARPFVAMGEGRIQSVSAGATRRNIELWPLLVLVALLGLVGEWYLYHRRSV